MCGVCLPSVVVFLVCTLRNADTVFASITEALKSIVSSLGRVDSPGTCKDR